jgi:GTP-binding protein LepA
LMHTDNAYSIGKKMCEKKELIQTTIWYSVQAAIGVSYISWNDKALRKDVTAKCYGGDISRKRKL